jgi:hypothetical protein
MQIYLLDTQTGARQLMTQGVDGNLPFFHPTLPVLSPDGTQLLFASAATNLVADDTNGLSDVIIQTIGSGARTLLRGAPIPIDATPYVFGPISPDGHFAFASFWKAGETNLYLVGLTSGQISAAVPGGPPACRVSARQAGKSLLVWARRVEPARVFMFTTLVHGLKLATHHPPPFGFLRRMGATRC